MNSPREAEQSAELLYQHQLLQWEDAVAHAQTLRERRNSYLTALAVFAGLGAFRLTWTRAKDEVPIFDGPLVPTILAVLAAFSIFTIAPAVWYTFTERSTARPWVFRWGCRVLVPLPKGHGAGLLRPLRGLRARLRRHRIADGRLPRASERLAFTPPEKELLRRSPVATVWWARTEALTDAYVELVRANSRVAARLRLGGFFLVLSFALLALAFGVYLVAQVL